MLRWRRAKAWFSLTSGRKDRAPKHVSRRYKAEIAFADDRGVVARGGDAVVGVNGMEWDMEIGVKVEGEWTRRDIAGLDEALRSQHQTCIEQTRSAPTVS